MLEIGLGVVIPMSPVNLYVFVIGSRIVSNYLIYRGCKLLSKFVSASPGVSADYFHSFVIFIKPEISVKIVMC